MSKKISKLAILTDNLIESIPNECESKEILKKWLIENPYSPYVTLYGGINSLKFDKSSSFISSLDNLQRFKINDEIKLKIENFYNFNNKILSANNTLENLINAEELFQHYPLLKHINLQMNISYLNKGFKESKIYHENNKTSKIEITADSNLGAMSALIYELQHAIQLQEGFHIEKAFFNTEENIQEVQPSSNRFQTLEEATELIKNHKLFQDEILYKNIFLNPEYFFETKNMYKSKVVLLTPDEYLEAVKIKQPKHPLDFRKIRKLEELYKMGVKFEIPYIKYGSVDIDEESDRNTFKQEGYHRCIIAKDKKIDKIPVIISYRDNDESIPKFIKNKLNDFNFDKKEIYNKIFSENGKFKLDKHLRNNIPVLNKSFESIESFKKNVPKYIDSPVGKIKVNLSHAFNHMNRHNSTRINRTKYNGNFAKDLINPLLVIKSMYEGKESYYFYNICKDENNNLINTLHCLIKDNKEYLEHKTFYKFENGLGKIKKFINECEIVHCHKLLTNKAIDSEQIHYSNANEILHKKKNNVNQEKVNDVEYPKNLVFHGSNYDFEKFSSNFNKNGIGANLYGFGLYFSDSKQIAKGYGKELGVKITIDGVEYDSLNPHHYAISILKSNCNVFKNAIFELKRELEYALPENYEFQKRAYEILKKEKENIYNHKKEIEDNSIIYTVKIPNKRYFLKENSSIATQTKEIVKIFEKCKKDSSFPNKNALELFLQNKLTGMELYNKISESFNGNDKKTSDFLNDLGIKGMLIKNITFFDKSNNYVIFNEKDVEIVQKETKEEIIVYKTKDNYKKSDNEKDIDKLLTIVPTGLEMHHVKDYLFYNGISDYFSDTNKNLFVNKLDYNYFVETQKINSSGLIYNKSAETEAKEIENLYIKSVLDLDQPNEIVKVEEVVTLNDFKSILDDIEIENFEKNTMKDELLEEGEYLEKEQDKNYEVIARFKVTI